MTETDIDLIEGLRKQKPKTQRAMLDRYGREPWDIYLPMSIGTSGKTGAWR